VGRQLEHRHPSGTPLSNLRYGSLYSADFLIVQIDVRSEQFQTGSRQRG